MLLTPRQRSAIDSLRGEPAISRKLDGMGDGDIHGWKYVVSLDLPGGASCRFDITVPHLGVRMRRGCEVIEKQRAGGVMSDYDMLCSGFVAWAKKATPALVAIFVIQLVTASSQAIAADYPGHTIKVVTPFAPGAASDVELRFLAEKMSKALHVGVVVENRPGSGGVAAGKAVSNAAPDGYTIAWVGNSNAIAVSLFREPFDPRVEMRPIVGVSDFANLFVTNDKSPFHTLQDVIKFAHENPNKLNIGTSGAGTSNNLVAHLFALQADIKVTIVPYRGPSELQIAIERGDIDLLVNAYASAGACWMRQSQSVGNHIGQARP